MTLNSVGLGQLQQDNFTPHTPGVTTEWLQGHSTDFRHFRRPPKYPDMGIIEHIWDAIQRAVRKRYPTPRTPFDLWTALNDSRCDLPPTHQHAFAKSMPRGVAALLRIFRVQHDII